MLWNCVKECRLPSFLPSFMKLFLLCLLVCFTLLLTGELLGNLKHFIFFFFFIIFFRSLYSSFSSKGYFKWWSLLSVIKLAVWPQLWNGNSCVAIVSILFQYLCSVEATQSSGRPVWYINEEGKNLQFPFFCESISNASDKWNGLKLNGL